MAVVIDSKMPEQEKEWAKEVVKELLVDNLTVSFEKETNLLVFTQDRRVVSVPTVLVKTKNWSEVRFLFRAILDSANSAWNYSSDKNDWSAYKGNRN